MKFIQLEYFCAVCRCHSITQAAQNLYVTQPAISSAIRELEKEFSVKLFTRSKNHITLTSEGEIFYQKACNLLNTYHQTSSELHDLGKQISTVRLGIPPLLSTIFFPDMLVEFKKAYPGIPVELFEYGSMRAASLVSDDSLDAAIVNLDFYETEKLNSHTMISDKVVFCVSGEHHLAGNKAIAVDMLENEPLIMYNTDSVLNSTLNSRFDGAGIKPNVVMHASQLYTIERFIKQGLGGAFLYSSLMKNLPDLVGIPVEPVIMQDIGLVWKKERFLNSSVEKFISFCSKSYLL